MNEDIPASHCSPAAGYAADINAAPWRICDEPAVCKFMRTVIPSGTGMPAGSEVHVGHGRQTAFNIRMRVAEFPVVGKR